MSNGNDQAGKAVEKSERRYLTGGFESHTGGTAVEKREGGQAGVVAREEAELKGAIVTAKHFPRDEAAAFTKVMKSAKRPSFAEGAAYSYPRGGQKVEGPSVKLAREIGRCWGNLRYGIRLVTVDEDYVHIKGWALDLETNSYVEVEDKFERLIYRKREGWVKPDERDLRELVNRRGAICERNALLKLLPPDLVDEAMRTSKQTMVKAAKGEIDQDREATIRRLALAFSDYGVKTDHLSAYLGHPLETIQEEELADLRTIYTSLKDGNSRPDEHFDLTGPAEAGAEDLNERIRQKREENGEGEDAEEPPSDEDDDSPPSDSQVTQLRQLMDKAEIETEEAEELELLIHDEDGPGVRSAIRELQKRLAKAGEEQEALGV